MSGLALKVGTALIEGVALAGIENLENLKGSAVPDSLPCSGLTNSRPWNRGTDRLYGVCGIDALNSGDRVRTATTLLTAGSPTGTRRTPGGIGRGLRVGFVTRATWDGVQRLRVKGRISEPGGSEARTNLPNLDGGGAGVKG